MHSAFHAFSAKGLTGDDLSIANEMQRQEFMYSKGYAQFLDKPDAEIEKKLATRKLDRAEIAAIKKIAAKRYDSYKTGYAMVQYDWHKDHRYRIPNLRKAPYTQGLDSNGYIRYNE